MSDVISVLLSRTRPRLAPSVAIVGALLLHGAVASAAMRLAGTKTQKEPEVEMVMLPTPEPPPPPEEPPPPPPEAKPDLQPTTPAPNAPTTAAAPPPAPAAGAAPILAANDDGPVDLTNGMVVGSAETYAGGVTSAQGTAKSVGGHGAPSSTGTGTGAAPAAPPPPPAPSGPDQSRRPQLGEGSSWKCPFPAEADQNGVDSAVVRLAIEVDASGAIRSVRVESEPGSGFGREAAQCARSKRFLPALDRNGQAVPGSTRVNVRFDR